MCMSVSYRKVLIMCNSHTKVIQCRKSLIVQHSFSVEQFNTQWCHSYCSDIHTMCKMHSFNIHSTIHTAMKVDIPNLVDLIYTVCMHESITDFFQRHTLCLFYLGFHLYIPFIFVGKMQQNIWCKLVNSDNSHIYLADHFQCCVLLTACQWNIINQQLFYTFHAFNHLCDIERNGKFSFVIQVEWERKPSCALFAWAK